MGSVSLRWQHTGAARFFRTRWKMVILCVKDVISGTEVTFMETAVRLDCASHQCGLRMVSAFLH